MPLVCPVPSYPNGPKMDETTKDFMVSALYTHLAAFAWRSACCNTGHPFKLLRYGVSCAVVRSRHACRRLHPRTRMLVTQCLGGDGAHVRVRDLQLTQTRTEQVKDIMSQSDIDDDKFITFGEFLPWYRTMAERHWRSTHGGKTVFVEAKLTSSAPQQPEPVQGAERVKLKASGPPPRPAAPASAPQQPEPVQGALRVKPPVSSSACAHLPEPLMYRTYNCCCGRLARLVLTQV